MSNLNIDKSPIILNLIEDAGNQVVFRAPYWSCDGPIEYVLNTIHIKLQMDQNGVDNVDELVVKINDIIFVLVFSSCRAYFVHVGFP